MGKTKHERQQIVDFIRRCCGREEYFGALMGHPVVDVVRELATRIENNEHNERQPGESGKKWLARREQKTRV